MRRNRLLVVAALVATVGATVGLSEAPVDASVDAVAQGTVCVGEHLTDLNRLFEAEPAGLIGADYQRSIELPDGRVFWTFQDGVVRVAPDRIEVVHNVAAIQDGPCVTFLYRGTRTAPRPYLFAEATVPYVRWYWPLGAELGTDGLLYVFAAEVRELGTRYLAYAEPVATRVAVIDPDTLSIIWEGSPADSSADLYGWSITSDADWTYLYGHCLRQFGFDDIFGVASHDLDCADVVTVARVPCGDLLATPRYWDGSQWQADPDRAMPVFPTQDRLINANQVVWTGGRFMSINLLGDWWGDTIVVSTSTSATGPFVATESFTVPTLCSSCTTFFASWVPHASGDRPERTLGYGLSNNRWDGEPSPAYHPTFGTVDAPTFLPAGGVFRVPVPTDDGAPVLNVTAVRPDGDGFVTTFPCDEAIPTASTLNFRDGATTANVALVRASVGGEVCVYSHAATDLVVDVAGGLGDAFAPEPVPRRLVDTRSSRPLVAGETTEVPVPGAAGVALNVTAVRPADHGFLTVFPCGGDVPTASNLNVRAGDNTANLAVVRPGAGGRACVFTSVGTDLVVDLAGTFSESFAPEPAPVRLLDTRNGTRVAAGAVAAVEIPDVDDATAGAVVNVTAVQPSANGFVTAFPCGSTVPTASNVNYRAGQNRAGLSIVRPGDGGRVCVFTSAEIDLVVDLTGTLDSTFVPRDVPTRLVDTRLMP